MYSVLTTGILLENSESLTKQAIAGFEARQRWLRALVKLGLQNMLWVHVLIVLIDNLVRWSGRRSLDWTFRAMVPGMVGRRGVQLISASGIRNEPSNGSRTKEGERYLGLVPGICRESDVVVVVCKGVKVPIVLRRECAKEEGMENGLGEWEFIGDCYVHGVMEGEAWDEQRCVDFWVV